MYSDEGLSERSSSTHVVIWKTEETFTPLKWPVVRDGEGEEVGLLKDWRERFDVAARPDSTGIGLMVGEHEGEVTNKSEGNAARTSKIARTGRVENRGRPPKRQAGNKKEEDPQPRKRDLPTRQAVNPASGTTSKLPIASRKRKAEEVSDQEDETETAPRKAATGERNTIRSNVSVVIPSSKSRSGAGQKKGGEKNPAQKKTNGAPSSAPATEAGNGGELSTRRSKRSKPV